MNYVVLLIGIAGAAVLAYVIGKSYGLRTTDPAWVPSMWITLNTFSLVVLVWLVYSGLLATAAELIGFGHRSSTFENLTIFAAHKHWSLVVLALGGGVALCGLGRKHGMRRLEAAAHG